ncbi:MAG: LEA type 2 family protein [Chromatiales bacterium]|nr:LEA type 2 family protein [Chromatiales bacterium]
MKRRLVLTALATTLAMAACTGLAPRDPLQVTVGGVEALPGEGLELRMLLKLRVQNPNDTPVDYSGVYVNLDVQGRTFATGVSDASGSVPRYGETVIGVPVTISAMRMARQMMGMMGGVPADKIRYEMSGKLNGPGFGAARFRSEGELTLPTAPAATGRP